MSDARVMLIKAQEYKAADDQTAQIKQLGPYYYLENFMAMLSGVEQRYGDLLDKIERDFIQSFNLLQPGAQCLLVRLITRKGPWFCRPQLNYHEIKDLQGAIQALVEVGFIHYDQPPLSWILQQTTKTELIRHLVEIGQGLNSDLAVGSEPSSLAESVQTSIAAIRQSLHSSQYGWLSSPSLKQRKKSELVSLITSLEHASTPIEGSQPNHQRAAREFITTFLQRLAPREHWFCITEKVPYRRFELLYFERLSQSLSQFILADLGIHQFESYMGNGASRSFNTRAEIEVFYNLSHLHQQLEDVFWTIKQTGSSIKKIDSLCVGLTAFTDIKHERLARLYQGIILQLARQYERLQEFETALTLYEACDRPPSRERRVRCLQKLAKDQQALDLVVQMLASPIEQSERLVARRLQKTLHRNLKLPAPPTWQGQFSTFRLTSERTSYSVEQSAAKKLAVVTHKKTVNSRSADITETVFCYEVENRLFCSLFGLAFWDIIFSDVKGAFAHPYQSRPSDMYYPSFYSLRRTAIEARLDELKGGNIASITRHFHQKFGLTNDWVHWPLFMAHELIHDSFTVLKKEAQNDTQPIESIGYMAGQYIDDLITEGKVSSDTAEILALPDGDNGLPLILNLALQAFPGPILAKLFRQMLFDLRYYRSGFPDLIRFHLSSVNVNGMANNVAKVGVELIEVKGPGDSLRDNQQIWLDWFNRQGFQASVCYLSWEG